MLKNTFCSSPWFHLRISYDGSFEKCRWLKTAEHNYNINETSILTYHNSAEMAKFRVDMLNGCAPSECDTCYYQEKFGKLSGRQKQLLKSGIRTDDFTNSLLSSPHFDDFGYSHIVDGLTDHRPTDIQVDLGNLCNSACIMCNPEASSKLTQDYIKLYKKSDLFKKPPAYKSWTSDPVTLDRFLVDLEFVPDLKYMHLLGGETLYNDAFYKICNKLISTGRSRNIIVGTTTNGTIYTEELEEIIPRFKEFHLGISIETVSPLNDYIRYPGDIKTILSNIDKFLALREQYPSLYITLRITPNIFTAYELDQLFEYVIDKQITVESCNILFKPESLRMELMPEDIRAEIINKLESLVAKYDLQRHNVTNIRKSFDIDKVTADSVYEYLDFIKGFEVPADIEQQRKNLVEFLKSFESLRNNSILDYAPRYKDFLRSIGY